MSTMSTICFNFLSTGKCLRGKKCPHTHHPDKHQCTIAVCRNHKNTRQKSSGKSTYRHEDEKTDLEVLLRLGRLVSWGEEWVENPYTKVCTSVLTGEEVCPHRNGSAKKGTRCTFAHSASEWRGEGTFEDAIEEATRKAEMKKQNKMWVEECERTIVDFFRRSREDQDLMLEDVRKNIAAGLKHFENLLNRLLNQRYVDDYFLLEQEQKATKKADLQKLVAEKVPGASWRLRTILAREKEVEDLVQTIATL